MHPPSIVSPNPDPIETQVSPEVSRLSFTVMDEDFDLLNVTLSTVPDIGQLSLTNVMPGTYHMDITKSLDSNTTYEWTVWVSDGGYTVKESFYFTTMEEPRPPVISLTEPGHEEDDVSIAISVLSFTLSDPNGDPMDVYIELDPGSYKINRVQIKDGRHGVPIPYLLDYGTSYTWRIMVHDGVNWTNRTIEFTTQLVSEYGPPEQPSQDIPLPGFKLIMILLIVVVVFLAIKLLSTLKSRAVAARDDI